MTRIASSLPGRIRVRDPQLRLADRLERLRSTLAASEGVISAEANPVVGSLLLHYDAAKVAPEIMEVLVDAAVDAELATPRHAYPPSTRVRINRVAKHGMLGSLALSLVLAAAGQKRWHVISGGLFVAFLGLHLAVHRRRLLR